MLYEDITFDAGDPRYRELKAALEGSLVAPPENVRIVATSNRRHLLPESTADNRGAGLDDEGELHLGEALEEKLAVSDRFGLVLGFYGFDQATYLEIVDRYAARAAVRAAPDQLHSAALRWALDRSSRSGRTARQFVDDFAGRESLDLASRITSYNVCYTKLLRGSSRAARGERCARRPRSPLTGPRGSPGRVTAPPRARGSGSRPPARSGWAC